MGRAARDLHKIRAAAVQTLRPLVVSRRGISLVVVLWVLALLMIMATELVYTVRVDSLTASNFRDETIAQALAVSGIKMGIAEVVKPYKFVVLDNDGKVSFVMSDDGMREAIRAYDLGEGRVEYSIEDESGKLNLNKVAREPLVNIFRDSGVEGSELDTIVDSILDWRDLNHEHHLNGAESDYYSSLPRPYGAKDGPFDTIEELLLVKGMKPEIFYGSEGTSAREGNESTVSDFKCVAEHLTVWGEGRINVNTASKEVLEAFFGKGRAYEILLRRETEGYHRIPHSGGIVSSGYFTIISTGIVRGISFRIRAAVEKRDAVRIVYWNEEGTPVGN